MSDAVSDPRPPAAEPDGKSVLAASAPWLGALLNLLPGLGTGYIYQRRWRAYWITSLLAVAAFLLGLLGPGAADPAEPAALTAAPFSTAGLLLLALVTAVEAFLTARRARMD
jgi:hypothetical protein